LSGGLSGIDEEPDSAGNQEKSDQAKNRELDTAALP
jgi:hypothetical protein